jgi:tetratricopeptide (TPR) repeat protein
MNRPLFIASVALAWLAGCSERSSSTPSTPQMTSSNPQTLARSKVTVDAGSVSDEELPDVLGLSHDDNGGARHLDRLGELKVQGDVEAALLEGRKALFDDPTDTDALLETAQLAQRARELHLAVLAYERLGELSSEDAAPLLQHARILLELEDFDGAVTVAEQAVDRDDQNPDSHLVLGRALLSSGNLAQAIESFETTLTLSPDHPYALNNLGFAYLRANRNEEAVTALERAVELLPSVAFVHNNLGVAYERVGRSAEARLAYEDAVAAAPRYIKARLNAERMDRDVAKVEAAGMEGNELEFEAEEPIVPEVLSE